MAIPKNITKEDILAAAGQIDRDGIEPGRQSYDRYIVLNKRLYPPKYLVDIANRIKNGVPLPSKQFISDEAENFLKTLGFKTIAVNPDASKFIVALATKKEMDLWGGFRKVAQYSSKFVRISKNLLFPAMGLGYYQNENKNVSLLLISEILHKPGEYNDINIYFEFLSFVNIKSWDFIKIIPVQYRSKLFTIIDNSFIEEAFPSMLFPKLKTPDTKELKETFKLNTILYGPPGTGKTFHTKDKSINIINNKTMSGNNTGNSTDGRFSELCDEGRIKFITFHPSYAYEDFMEGIRPDTKDANGQVKFILRDGIFKEMCLQALNAISGAGIKSWEEYEKDKKNEIHNIISRKLEEKESFDKYVIIIDEINRGDISKIFGELITLIEEDKRIGAKNEITVRLPYSGHNFGIPPNLYIVGTMNTADRSLALIDVALRRRFFFEEMPPRLDELRADPAKFGAEVSSGILNKSITALENINKKLGKNPDIGKDKKIGHAYLCNITNENELNAVWKDRILPLLEEYYYFDREELERFSGNLFSSADGWRAADNISEIINHFENWSEQE